MKPPPFSELETNAQSGVQALRHHLTRAVELRVATLGPAGTSSEASAKYLLSTWGGPGSVQLFPSFEDAAAAVQSGACELLLVANAYQGIDRFYMEPGLSFFCAYVFDTPPYGLAARPGWQLDPRAAQVVVSHPAPVSLIPWFLERQDVRYEVVHSPSTAAAASSVQEGHAPLCVTNAVACAQHGLQFVSRTRPIRMLWSLFGSSCPPRDPGHAP